MILSRAELKTHLLSLRTISALRSLSEPRRLAVAAAAASESRPTKIEPPDVRKLAKLAQIKVTDEEVSTSASNSLVTQQARQGSTDSSLKAN